MANKHSLSVTNALEKSGDSISSLSNLQEDGMCEKVQSLADSVYREFEQLIGVYGEQVLKELMPLVVAMLENLEQAMRDRQRLEVDAEMLRVDNEQLIGQYEKERGMRRNAEQRYLALEDQMDDERKQLQGRLEKMSSVVRMFEIKLKNSQDQVKRMEEKEEEGKKEYTKLHDRFNNLFKMHVDLKNKTKKEHFEVYEEEKNPAWDATLPRNFKFKRSSKDYKDDSSMPEEEANKDEASDEEAGQKRLIKIDDSLRRSLIGEMDEASKKYDEEASYETEIKPFDSLSEHDSSHADDNAFPDNQDDEEAEPCGGDDDFVSGVGKEIEGLIHENQELLQTKHALNIVKDDLIARVDELTGEKEILRDELDSMNESRERLRARLNQCEENVRSLKEQLDATKDQPAVDVDEMGTSGQRKRFTRVEMARVLMERNLYKEKLMELQEAVRWAEMIRATKNQIETKNSKSSVWNFFSNLFSNNNNSNRDQHRNDHSAVSYHRNDNDAKRNRPEQDPPVIIREKSLAVLFQDKNRVQAYGWSLPPRYHNITSSQLPPSSLQSPPSSSLQSPPSSSLQPSSSSLQSPPSISSSSSSRDMTVAVPVMCKPLMDDVMASKIQCAVTVVWKGAKHYQRRSSERSPLSKTLSFDAEIGSSMDDEDSPTGRRRSTSSSQTSPSNITDVNIWICVIDQTGSHVAVMDTAGGGDVIEKFNVCTANVMCMTFVPGYQEFNEEDEEEDELDDVDDDDKSYKRRKESFEVEIPLEDIDEKDESATNHNEADKTKTKENKRDEDREGGVKEKDGGKVGESHDLLVQSCTDVPTSDPIQVSMVHVEDPDDLKHTNLLGKLHRKLSRSNSKTPPRDVDLDNFLNSNATVWVGSIAGNLYVFSAAPYSRNRLHLLKLPDSILSISHSTNQVFVAMANGSVACFSRLLNGAWNMKKYVLVQLNASIKGAIRSTLVVDNTHLWISVGNLIHAINIRNLSLLKSFSAHPRRESHVREMVLVGEGVWVVLRNESTLHLFHSTSFQHLQDVDIEPCVSQLLGSSYMGFSLVQISCLMAMEDNLWIGTGNGVILRVPLSDTFDNMQPALNPGVSGGGRTPGSLVRVASNLSQESKGRFMPYCSLTNSHVSLHGCREAIKFMVKAPTFKASKCSARQLFRKFSNPLPTSTSLSLPPSTPTSTTGDTSWFVVCGGEGYVALKKEDNSTAVTGKEDGSHVIMWQTNVPSSQH